MKKHDAWTGKKHRSHLSGRRYLRHPGLKDALVKQVRRLEAELVKPPAGAQK